MKTRQALKLEEGRKYFLEGKSSFYNGDSSFIKEEGKGISFVYPIMHPSHTKKDICVDNDIARFTRYVSPEGNFQIDGDNIRIIDKTIGESQTIARTKNNNNFSRALKKARKAGINNPGDWRYIS